MPATAIAIEGRRFETPSIRGIGTGVIEPSGSPAVEVTVERPEKWVPGIGQDRGRTRLVRRSHFAAAIEGALADVRDELVIEMSSLEFMDCRGLDALARVSQRLGARNARLRVRHRPLVERLLDITDLGQHMTVESRASRGDGLPY